MAKAETGELMKDRSIEAVVEKRKVKQSSYKALMRRRVRNILLVSSTYDSFTFEEDGRLTEALFSDYVELNLRYAPQIVRVSTAEEALNFIKKDSSFDLVISMLRVGDMDVGRFGKEVKRYSPDLPVVLLAYDTREIDMVQNLDRKSGIDRIFVWLGDVRLFLAIIKYTEDKMNVRRDSKIAGVQSIILIEDNARFYSSYLPLLYTELVKQTQTLMADGLNRMDKLLRMRVRPKILLAGSYEEGEKLYTQNKGHIAGVITDASFPRGGKIDHDAGIEFAKMVKEHTPDRPVLVQSSDQKNEQRAFSVGAQFINKKSPSLLHDVQEFMDDHLGFGDFIFRMPDGVEIDRAKDMRSLTESLTRVPVESLLYHGGRNDISSWLMARTEFELARKLRPRKVSDFSCGEEIRQYLLGAIEDHSQRIRAGVVADFSSETFDASKGFVRIGSGSLGGKGRGLAFFHTLLKQYQIEERIPRVKISVPPTAVLATGVFDEFMVNSKLTKFVLGDHTDEQVTQVFIESPLPDEAMGILRTFLSRVKYPLAVRSSSLLEDASYQPFAGIYRTIMIPNNDVDLEVRLQRLATAIRLVYASTYYNEAKSYIDSTPSRIEEEKMAVVIQQIAGRMHGNYLYPDLAGVTRSYNFYPMEGMLAEEGVASVVLGLGKAVVDGKKSVRFSPAHPKRLYQFSSSEETLRSAQRDFYALDLNVPGFTEGAWEKEDTNVANLDLATAEKHGTLDAVGSVYSGADDVVYDGTSRQGVPLVTLAGVLKAGVFPLAETLSLLLNIGRAGFSSQVEIEFAANLSQSQDEPHEFSFLQIRPVVVSATTNDIQIDNMEEDNAICISNKALGHGLIENVHDVVYVPKESFDRSKTVEIAQEIGVMTARMRTEKRPILLIGPGRWGSADRWLGIPVTWKQIAGVRCIVETDMDDISVEPSQGTHFFQNITSFNIGYFTVNFDNDDGLIDMKWLDEQPAEYQTSYVRHLHFDDPLQIVINGKRGIGVVLKPGHGVWKTSILPGFP